MLNLEIHLPSSTYEKDIIPSLQVLADGHQYLILKEKMSVDFAHQDFFESTLHNLSEKDTSSISLARQDQVAKLRNSYIGEGEVDNNDEEETIWMMSSYRLPFHCDDVYSLPEDQRYPGTMSQFYVWGIVDTDINFDEFRDVDVDDENFVEPTQEQAQMAYSTDMMKVLTVRSIKRHISKLMKIFNCLNRCHLVAKYQKHLFEDTRQKL